MRLLLLVLALSLASPARGEDAPDPPEGHAPVVLETGQAWTAPAGGGLCLDEPAWVYQVEARRYLQVRMHVAELAAERATWKGALWGGLVGIAAGVVVALSVR